MPRYDYVCDTCGETVNLQVPVEDRDREREHFCEGDWAGTLRRKFFAAPTLGVHIFPHARAPRSRT